MYEAWTEQTMTTIEGNLVAMMQGTVVQDVSSKVAVVWILTGPQSSAIEGLVHRAAILRDEGFESFSGLMNELIQIKIHDLLY